MKNERIYVRVDEVFKAKLEYLRKLNGWRTISETIRKIVEKEHMREIYGNQRDEEKHSH